MPKPLFIFLLHNYKLQVLLLINFLIRFTQGSITLDGQVYPVYNALPWRPSFNFTNLPLVDLISDSSLFDYCNYASYSKDVVQNLLKSSGIKANEPWIALVNEKKMQINGNCSLASSLSGLYQADGRLTMYNQAVLNVYHFFSEQIAPLNASLLIDITELDQGTIQSLSVQRSFDLKDTSTGLNYAPPPGGTVPQIVTINAVRLSTLTDSELVDKLTKMKNGNKISIFDEERVDSYYFVYSNIWIYYIMCSIFVIISLVNVLLGSHLVRTTLRGRKEEEMKSKKAPVKKSIFGKMLILITILIRNIGALALFNYDFLNLFGVWDYSGVLLMILLNCFFGPYIMIFMVSFWIDFYQLILSALQFKLRKSFFKRLRRKETFFLYLMKYIYINNQNIDIP